MPSKAGPVRLDLPEELGTLRHRCVFPTPSGKCEFYSERVRLRAGRDPLALSTSRRTKTRKRTPNLAAKFPLQMLTPPAPSFLNSTFVNVDTMRRAAGEVTLEMHPTDAATHRGIANGQTVTVFNGRGRFRAKAVVGDSVKPGVVVSLGSWWTKYTAGRRELQHDHEHRPDRSRRRSHVLRQPRRSGGRVKTKA